MNIHNTMTALFPEGVVVDCGSFEAGSVEVHGLPGDAVPRNCEVLASGSTRFSHDGERQQIYLVKTDDFLVLLRIGRAGPDTADGAFVVSRGHVPVGLAQSDAFATTARNSIQALCRAPLAPAYH